MEIGDNSRAQSATIVALLVAAVAVATVGGIAFGAVDSGSDDRTAEEILSDAQTTYDDADSVVTDAVVTVETDDRTAEFELSAAAAGSDRFRLNVSDGERHLVQGSNGETVWLFEPTSGLTGVVDTAGNDVTASLRAGVTRPSGLGLSALPGDIDLDTELSVLLERFGGELPDGFEDELPAEIAGELPEDLDELPENTTVGDLLPDDRSATSLDGVLAGSGGALPEGLTAFELPENLGDSELFGDLDGFEFPESLDEFELPESLNELELPESLETFELSGSLEDLGLFRNLNVSGFEASELRASLDGSLTGEFNGSATTVELVGTTTVDGVEANEILLSRPADEAESRLWIDAESDALLKQETTAPGLTVTTDVRDTRFDVSPADSTFEAPGAVELASLTAAVGETADEFAAETVFETAVPAEEWAFERGVVLSGNAPALTDRLGIERTAVAAATYTADGSTLTVGQIDRAIDLEALPAGAGETISLDGRAVRLLSGPFGAAAVWTEAGSTVVVTGTDESRLRSAIADIELVTADA